MKRKKKPQRDEWKVVQGEQREEWKGKGVEWREKRKAAGWGEHKGGRWT